MSNASIPRQHALYSHATAAIGERLNRGTGEGTEHAKLVWMFVLSHTPWETLKRPTWANNETLAGESGLAPRRIKEALAILRESHILATPYGIRPGARRKFGRLLVPTLGAPCKVVVPDRVDMANLWGLCRERRKRPAPMVTMMVGAHALACDHANREGFAWQTLGDEGAGWTPLGCTQADWRRFVGARKNAAWTARVRECESLGLIRRSGRVVEVAPTRSWLRSDRAMAEIDRLREQEADESGWVPHLWRVRLTEWPRTHACAI